MGLHLIRIGVLWQKKDSMTIREHIKQGMDSNYSPCCILWFLFRLKLIHIGLYNPYWDTNNDNCDEYRHIACIFCKLYNKLMRVEIFYSYCRKCDWIQYRKMRCNVCHEMPYNPLERPHYEVIEHSSGEIKVTKTSCTRY